LATVSDQIHLAFLELFAVGQIRGDGRGAGARKQTNEVRAELADGIL
jgi:hypothetical protein